MSSQAIFTYQTRPLLLSGQDEVLDAYAQLHGQAERSLFAAIQAGSAINDLKQAFQPRFGISARQFNAMRVSLDGKIAAIKERRPELIAESETRVRKAIKVIAKLEKAAARSSKLHQKKRRLACLQERLAHLKKDHAAGVVRLCFGSKKLFRAQFDLTANGYAHHDEWKADWRRTRSNQFFVLGSQDESAGCQLCQASVAQDGTLDIELRLPDALAAHGKHIVLSGVRFAYGHDAIVAALGSSRRVSAQTKAGKAIGKRVGTALSYRFVRDDKGWRIFISAEAQPVATTTHRGIGAIGVDINADHLALSEADRFGNLILARRIDVPTYGKSTDQAKALIGDAAVSIAAQAKAAGKPVVIEQLHFQTKKAELETTHPKQARMLSSFACNKAISSIRAACFRAGVEVIEVNPAYTSVIGAVNVARSKGVSVHQGAAHAIARRGLALSERPILREAIVPTRNGGHVTFVLPVRNRAKHVWSFWSKVRTKLKAAHGAHFRSGDYKKKPAPLSPEMRTLGAYRSMSAQFRHASWQNCSANDFPDVPY
jgi:IS605 OrfB family transposase